jgi:hypothetical protein
VDKLTLLSALSVLSSSILQYSIGAELVQLALAAHSAYTRFAAFNEVYSLRLKLYAYITCRAIADTRALKHSLRACGTSVRLALHLTLGLMHQ